jgi:hypothetical protein
MLFNAMATVYTYYEPVAGMPRPTKLLDLWRESWESKGWETKILCEDDARAHPGFKDFSKRISRYPTTNPPGYERACYLRHMAMANIGGGLLVDYDVILRGKLDFDEPFRGEPVICEATFVPCMVLADSDGFGDICDIIYDYKPNGEGHVSDMTILRNSAWTSKIKHHHGCVEHLNSGTNVINESGDGWKTAPAILFSSFSFQKLGWRGDKADLIKRVLATL